MYIYSEDERYQMAFSHFYSPLLRIVVEPFHINAPFPLSFRPRIGRRDIA